MLKRNFALFIIMIATLLLMAHTLLPHHHHNDRVCLNFPFDKEDQVPENRGHDEDNSKICVVDHGIIIPANVNTLRPKVFHTNFSNQGVNVSPEIISPFLFNFLPSGISEELLQNSTQISEYFFASPVSGLRAPPLS